MASSLGAARHLSAGWAGSTPRLTCSTTQPPLCCAASIILEALGPCPWPRLMDSTGTCGVGQVWGKNGVCCEKGPRKNINEWPLAKQSGQCRVYCV